MAQTNVNIRMDEDLKREFEKFCSDVGMTMTTAVCVFAKATVLNHKIPFEISDVDENGFSKQEADEFKKRISEMNSGKGEEHKLIDV